jgi:phosphatidylglycerol---prolipoprotein diacylglyceryl transferase
MEFQAEAIELFNNFQIRYYGIIIVAAMLVAASIAAYIAKRDGQDPDHVWGLLTWAIIPGIIGARLFFVLFPPQDLIERGRDTLWFFSNFFNVTEGAIAVWSGGLNIFGAVIGGLLGALIYLNRQKLQTGYWLDLAGLTLPVAQAIGRFANFVNQELYGMPTTLPWGITIDRAKRVGEYSSLIDYPATTLFHPLFLYEALWSVAAFVILLAIYQRYRKHFLPGDFFLIYVAQYALVRFLLEFIRVQTSLVAGVNLWQLFSIVLFFGAVGWFLYRRRAPQATTAAA